MNAIINKYPHLALVVRAAFVEGFESGQDRGNLPHKYPPVDLAWLESETRRNELGLEFDEDCQARQREWLDKPYSERMKA